MLCLVWECKKHLSVLILCLLSFLISWVFILFLNLPFEYPCNIELTWMYGMDLCTNTETGRVWMCFCRKDLTFWIVSKTPCGLWPLTDPQFWITLWTVWEFWISSGSALNTWLIPPHGWTVWREEGPFHLLTPSRQTIPRCYWVGAPPGGWKKKEPHITTEEGKKNSFTHLSLPYNSPSGIP